ncbi:hypothetical protein RE6C_03164 [Rhodopirellula europaea 6C]|uniref:Uncharacterized protein n=1 Tax=Rhodopirellula europaea 6C TaxID=1263867 RepID=M2AGA1_9BACT|nr:hypothetical protein RE6C_03164 [Rhodopirellula europaea 6C]
MEEILLARFRSEEEGVGDARPAEVCWNKRRLLTVKRHQTHHLPF